MDDKVFFSGKLEKVYFYLGTFEQERSRRRFVKAPFDRLMLNGEAFVMPVSSFALGGPGNGGNGGLSGLLAVDEGNEFEFDLGQAFFFDTLENLVLERHEMGDWKGNKDNWLQVHQFGPV